MITVKKNKRGFLVGEFEDRYGKKCSIQESSLATESSIWLGCDEGTHVKDENGKEVCLARMHLTQEIVEDLIPLLDHFLYEGRLPIEEKYEVWVNTRVEVHDKETREDKIEIRIMCLGLYDNKETAELGLMSYAKYRYDPSKCYWNGTQLLIDDVPELRGYNIGFLSRYGESKR